MKKQSVFRATKLDQYLLHGIDKVLSVALEVKKVGPVKSMRFACKVAQEMILNDKVTFTNDARPTASKKYKLIKIDLDQYDLARVNSIAEGLGKLSKQSKKVTTRIVMQTSLLLAEKWLVEHAAQAERVNNGSLEQLMYYALIHCTKTGPGVGPSKIIKSCIEVSKQMQLEESKHK